MENPNLGTNLNEDHNNPRLKFLCSFNGSILPRPQDGKLRYVGGETRIVSVPRDIGFDELMNKMKELYESATVLKYQQPDEDLDALVSVVNDDDVVNMIEEYEKLGFGDGFTRVRLFLFSGAEDDSVGFIDRDNERRYVDALNSHNDGVVDDLESVESRFNQFNVDEGVHNQRNFEAYALPVNLQQVRIPHQQSSTHRFNEMESPWSPAYSPSSHYHSPYGDPVDKGFDRVHQPAYNQHAYDQHLQENFGGYPGNILPGSFYNMNINTGHTVYPDGNHYVHHRHAPEFGNEMFHNHAAGTGYVHPNVLWRNGQSQLHGHPGFEASGAPKQENGAFNLGFVRTAMDYGSRVPVGVENPSHHQLPSEPAQFVHAPMQNVPESAPLMSEPVQFVPAPMQSVPVSVPRTSEPVQVTSDPVQLTPEHVQLSPEVVQSTAEPVNDAKVKEETAQDLNAMDTPADLELESGSDARDNTKIEPTKAEEEAIARGLQTIKNDDLEEVKQLGSGTYGAVYHGKWKGSDVAIKKIKASCFAGRPSERERLIADFWKEALILSSLHHPNVVAFYGIVRDGPDGSLATVTEFMVNGSLKQFLQKKDRTIDRRKRLIIAMDASFGMEYLHGKNIVHFDLKCENLLVNMRDPHRPICKIGDLGLSKVKQHTLVSGGVRGTLPWMAPELLSGKSNMVSEKIDVYSFGIVMWELLTGDEPYGDMHCASIIGGIVNNSLRPTIPTWCDPEWKALMESCWSADPAERPSFSEISQKLRNMAAGNNVK
ncbi:uncharacterized protein LOC143634048 [Bidens hawaiensis]|uniref:uncharacterized protein LOC143634048 n=1 Tax=Bidens hawaiensis TaxID=980011 RepID=UPI00404912E5